MSKSGLKYVGWFFFGRSKRNILFSSQTKDAAEREKRGDAKKRTQ